MVTTLVITLVITSVTMPANVARQFAQAPFVKHREYVGPWVEWNIRCSRCRLSPHLTGALGNTL